MNEKLRPQYRKLLSRHGLRPHSIPANWTDIAKTIRNHKIAAAKAKGDEYLIPLIEEAYETSLRDPLHPADRMLRDDSAWVEEALRKSRHAGRFADNVFVGDFPTGAFNAHAKAIKGGFLILVNSGAGVLIRTIYSLLASSTTLDDLSESSPVVSKVGAILDSYLRTGDPMYGPLNEAEGSSAMLAVALTESCRKFMIAHEYAHVVAGHLNKGPKKQCSLPTLAGNVRVFRKPHAEELEADLIAYELLIGASDPSRIDMTHFRRLNEGDGSALGYVMEQAALVVGPQLFLAIDLLLQRAATSFADPRAGFEASKTHPSTVDRMKQINNEIAKAPDGTTGLLGFGIALRRIGDLLEQRRGSI